MAFSLSSLIKPAIGGIAGGILGATGQPAYNPNLAPALQQYGKTIGGIAGAYDPYVQQGQQALSGYGAASAQNVADPTAMINKISSGYAESPYQKQMDQNLSRMMNYNAANTGMLGSTSANEALQSSLAGQQNQFMQQYLNQALGQYGQGISGLSDISHLGFQGLGQQTGLQQEAALAQARASMQPPKPQKHWYDALTGAAGGILGFM